MLRVSMNTSLMAAHTASVSTVMNSSTTRLATRKVSSPTRLTAVPSANRPTSGSVTSWPWPTDCAMASESRICTPMIFTSGRTALMYAPTPLISPPPPMARNTAASGPWCWRRISMPMVPWPAMTSGSSKGWMKVRPCAACNRTACS